MGTEDKRQHGGGWALRGPSSPARGFGDRAFPIGEWDCPGEPPPPPGALWGALPWKACNLNFGGNLSPGGWAERSREGGGWQCLP